MSILCPAQEPQICLSGVLDCSLINVRIFERDMTTGDTGAPLTTLDGCKPSYIFLDWSDECGDYMGDNVPAAGVLEVTNGVGSETFSGFQGGVTNRYTYTPPLSVSPQTVDFSFGTLNPAGDLVTCTFSLTVDGCELDEDHTLFTSIATLGLANACYPDNNHYLAEFYLQNPNVCYATIDTARQCIVPTPLDQKPTPTLLPAATGNDDTDLLENAIQPGGVYQGNGTYRINQLTLTEANITLCDLSVRPTSNTGIMIDVRAPNVKFDNLDLDALDTPSVYHGIKFDQNSDGFEIINSSFRNVWHRRGGVGTDNINGSFVFIRGTDNYNIRCNRFVDFLNDTGVSDHRNSSVTARASGIWIHGGNTYEQGEGWIVSNYFENFQSNGPAEDSEAITTQSHANNNTTNGIVHAWGNVGVNAGKRWVKTQTDGFEGLSNDYWWKDLSGPLQNRGMRDFISAPLSSGISDITHRNNRFRDSTGDWQFGFTWETGQANVNNHVDCNEIILDVDNFRSDSGVLFAVKGTLGTTSTAAPINSSMKDNVVLGAGRPRYYYQFDPVVPQMGNPPDISGNVFTNPALIATFQ